jgi:chromosome segregation ATPase
MDESLDVEELLPRVVSAYKHWKERALRAEQLVRQLETKIELLKEPGVDEFTDDQKAYISKAIQKIEHLKSLIARQQSAIDEAIANRQESSGNKASIERYTNDIERIREKMIETKQRLAEKEFLLDDYKLKCRKRGRVGTCVGCFATTTFMCGKCRDQKLCTNNACITEHLKNCK